MTNDMREDLEGQVREKSRELQERVELMDRYARTIGRDRWYNRGCQDVATLRQELKTLQAQLAQTLGQP